MVGAGVLVAAGLAAVVAILGWSELSYPEAEIEPNDVPAQATPIGPGRATSGILERREGGADPDRDYYRIEFLGTEPRLIRVDVSAVPDVDLGLELLGTDGGILATANNSGTGFGELIPNQLLPRGGAYFIAVHSSRILGGSEAAPARYRISTALRVPGSNDESEPNDDEATATRIVAGLPAVAFAGAAGDVDCFSVVGPGGGTLSAEATAVPDVDLAIEVRRPREAATLRVVDEAAASQPERLAGVAWPASAPPPIICIRRKEPPANPDLGSQRGEAPSLATPYFVLAHLVR